MSRYIHSLRSLVYYYYLFLLLIYLLKLLMDYFPMLCPESPRGDHIFPVALFPLGLTGIPRVWPRWEEDAGLDRLCGC